MFPREDPKQSQSRDEALGRLWDALQGSGTLGSPDIESEDINTITRLHDAEDIAPPEDELIQRMWAGIRQETGIIGQTTAAVSPNGNLSSATGMEIAYQVPAQLDPVSSERYSPPLHHRIARFIARSIRAMTLATLAGFVTGFLVVGGGARIAMRIAAMLSDERLQGVRTENEETVGAISLGGSFELMMTGAFAGIAACIVYLAIRSWLPQAGWKRSLTTGFILFAASGSLMLEGGANRDYERFGIAGLNICLFTVLPFLFGLFIGPVTDWFDSRISDTMPRFSRNPSVMLKSTLMCLPAPFVLMALMFMLFEPSAMILLLVLPIIIYLCDLAMRLFSFSFANRVTTRLSYAGLAVTCLVGLVLTAQAVGRIL